MGNGWKDILLNPITGPLIDAETTYLDRIKIYRGRFERGEDVTCWDEYPQVLPKSKDLIEGEYQSYYPGPTIFHQQPNPPEPPEKPKNVYDFLNQHFPNG